MGNEIEKISIDNRISFNNAIQSCVAFVTGAFAAENKDLIISLGALVQNMRAGKFLNSLKIEFEKFVEAGKISEDYGQTDQNLNSMQELFDFLEKGVLDDKKCEILKKIFLVMSTEKYSSRDDILPVEFMRIAKSLSVSEYLILNACFLIDKGIQRPSFSYNNNSGWIEEKIWIKAIAEVSGLKYVDLVILNTNLLCNKQLITKSSASGSVEANNFRLSLLGMDFCQYIAYYEHEKNEI